MGKNGIRMALASAVLALLLFNQAAFANAEGTASAAEILVSGGNQYKAVRLTPEIYNRANGDLSDLLVRDGSGDPVPYFIHSGPEKENEERVVYPMRLVYSYTEEDRFYLDYRVREADPAEGNDRIKEGGAIKGDARGTGGPEHDVIATSIRFSTNQIDFAKIIRVYGSHDNLHWEFVREDKLFAIDGNEKLSVDFGVPQKYTHYRVEFANNLEKIAFQAVDLVYNQKDNERSYFIECLVPVFYTQESDQTTLIHIEGLKNLRLCEIAIETDSMFRRIVTAPFGARKELYNLSLNGTSYQDMALPLDGQVSREDTYVVAIANHDDAPIQVKGITARYYADEVVFAGAKGERYALEFGADMAKTAPVYDIVRYQDEILKGPIDRVAIGQVSFGEEAKEPAPVMDARVVFNGVVIVVAALLGGVIVARLKRKG